MILLYMSEWKKKMFNRIIDKLGLMIDNGGLRVEVYKEKEDKLLLSLNEWVEYPFNIKFNSQYWVMRALYT